MPCCWPAFWLVATISGRPSPSTSPTTGEELPARCETIPDDRPAGVMLAVATEHVDSTAEGRPISESAHSVWKMISLSVIPVEVRERRARARMLVKGSEPWMAPLAQTSLNAGSVSDSRRAPTMISGAPSPVTSPTTGGEWILLNGRGKPARSVPLRRGAHAVGAGCHRR